MNNSTVELGYCGKSLNNFKIHYHQVHGYISLVVCLFGSVANSLNIAVLTRREMRSPTNAILTGLACADLLVMLDYIPFVLEDCFISAPMRFSYGLAAYVLFHSNFAQVMY